MFHQHISNKSRQFNRNAATFPVTASFKGQYSGVQCCCNGYSQTEPNAGTGPKKIFSCKLRMMQDRHRKCLKALFSPHQCYIWGIKDLSQLYPKRSRTLPNIQHHPRDPSPARAAETGCPPPPRNSNGQPRRWCTAKITCINQLIRCDTVPYAALCCPLLFIQIQSQEKEPHRRNPHQVAGEEVHGVRQHPRSRLSCGASE